MMTTTDTLVPEQLWQAIQPLLPTPPCRYGGRPRVDDRACLVGIVYQLRTGVPWPLLPTRQLGCGSPITCWRRLRDWQRAGVWQQLHHRLLDQLGRNRRLDWSRASLASVSVRAKPGLPDRPEPDRPRQARKQGPPPGRPPRHPLGRLPVGGHHP
jgi:transposase